MNQPPPDTKKADALIAELNALHPIPDMSVNECLETESIDRLDEIIQELWATGAPERATAALFGVFERFPNGYDAYGVFWSILHGLESLPNCGEELVASVRRVPVEFNLSMVNRFLNGGYSRIGDTDLMELLRETAERTDIDDEARNEAQHYVEYQESK